MRRAWTCIKLGGGAGAWLHPEHLDLEPFIAAYWRGDVAGMETVREHKWGGRVERASHPESGAVLYFKRFSIRGPRYLHKPWRARHTLAQEAAIKGKGFRGPDVICLIERRRFGLLVDSAVISVAMPPMPTVMDYLQSITGDSVLRRAFLRQFAGEVGRWHAAGLFHGDMNLRNVQFDEGDQVFYWVDNEEGRTFDVIPRRYRVHDLTHINRYRYDISRSDRMRLWKAYVTAAGITCEEADTCLRQVVMLSRVYWKKRGWL